MITWQDRINNRLDEYGWTYTDLAANLEVTPSRVSQMMSEDNLDAATHGTLRSLAAVLDCDLVVGFLPFES